MSPIQLHSILTPQVPEATPPRSRAMARSRLRQIADAALQLSLPLLEAAPPPAVMPVGRRVLRLGTEFVEYELKRSRRRTIGFVVDDRGLSVTAPRWVAQREIDAALAERAQWVLRKLVEWREHAKRRDRLAIRWEDGAAMPFLGTPIRLRVIGEHRDKPLLLSDELHIGLPPGAGSDQLRDRVQAWLQQRAREHFAERITHFTHTYGVAPRRWTLSSARTRWGSCAADGSVRLNWRLMHFPSDIIDYVIAHELAHLREMNHSPRFWSTVGELFPDWQRARAWLRSIPDDTETAG